MRTQTTDLVRVAITTPHRRIDLALPTNVAIAELLPTLLRHTGTDFADQGELHGGWTLRRADGESLCTARTLTGHGVLDGENLHLVPGRVDWPEVDYDDVVQAIADGSRQYGRPWTPATTRLVTLVTGSAVMMMALVLVLVSGPPWPVPGAVALGVAAVCLLGGTALSRGLADCVAGAFVASVGLPFAFVGGSLVVAGDQLLSELGAPSLLAGSALGLAASLLGQVGVSGRTRVFTAGVVVALVGLVGSGAAVMGMGTTPVLCLVLSGVTLATPAAPLLAIRLGRIPVPALPDSPGEIVDDQPDVPRPRVFASVARADEILTGALIGGSLAASGCVVLLVGAAGVAVALLVVVCSLVFLLRLRVFLVPRQRVPLLAMSLVGCAALVSRLAVWLGPGARVPVLVTALTICSAGIVSAGFIYSGRIPSPYTRRFLELFDAFLLILVIPVACAAAGVYQAVRGYFG